MSKGSLADVVKEDSVQWIEAKLEGSSVNKKVYWKEILTNAPFSHGEMVSAMNSILMPLGQVSGCMNYYWNGLPA